MGVAAWALVISIFAASISLASLAWQIVSWQRAGPRVFITKARATRLALDPDVVGKVEVEIVNKGRLAAYIDDAAAFFVDKGVLILAGHPGPDLPRKLEPQELVRLSIEAKGERRLLPYGDTGEKSWGTVTVWLGDKRIIDYHLKPSDFSI